MNEYIRQVLEFIKIREKKINIVNWEKKERRKRKRKRRKRKRMKRKKIKRRNK